jgi:hypothetical protein
MMTYLYDRTQRTPVQLRSAVGRGAEKSGLGERSVHLPQWAKVSLKGKFKRLKISSEIKMYFLRATRRNDRVVGHPTIPCLQTPPAESLGESILQRLSGTRVERCSIH